ncbi:MAG: MIP/aquaporin family protein [Janthinobacterium lividum]
MNDFRRALFAEALGTAILLLFGTGAIVVNDLTGAIGHGGIALAFGLIVLVLIQAFGPVSGAHLNPAVTVAFWVAGRFAGRQVLPYVVAQVLGGLVGSALLLPLAPAGSALGATLPSHGVGVALGVEIGLTFWLMLVVLQVAYGSHEQGLLAGITIGATVALEALVGGPLSGASMNPIRSLAPALVGGHLVAAWIYVVGPVAGALLAVAADKLLRPTPTPLGPPN